MARHLLRLPPELLLDIVELLHGDNASLAAICRTSRMCAELARPHLYRHVVLGNERARSFQVALLLRTLFDRPDHVGLVKTLSIEASIYRDYSEKNEVPSGARHMLLNNEKRLHRACIQRAKEIAQSSPSGVSTMIENWQSRLRNGYQTAYIGVLMAMLVSVTELAVTIFVEEKSSESSSQPLESLFGLTLGGWADEEHATTPRPHLPILASACNVTRLKISGLNLALLSLGFPSLEWLEILLDQQDSSGNSNDAASTGLCSLNHVKTVTFQLSWENNMYSFADCVAKLLAYIAFPRIESIRFFLVNSPTIWPCIRLGIFANLMEALEPVSPLLQTLGIDLDLDRCCSASDCGSDRTVNDIHQWAMFEGNDVPVSLNGFASLRKLRFPSTALVNHSLYVRDTENNCSYTTENLPPTLRSLDIMYPTAATLVWLQENFTDVGQCDTSLESVRLLCSWRWGKPPSWFERRRQNLNCLSVPVTIDVVPGHKMPADFIDVEVADVWDSPEASCLEALFGN